MKLTLYCKSKFLTDFFENRPREVEETLFTETLVDDWRNFRKMIFDNNLLLDISKNEFLELLKNPLWAKLGKKAMDSEIKLKFNKFPINYNLVDQHSIFFLSDDQECKNLEKEYGMLFISKENLFEKSKYLFSNDTFRKIDNKEDWNVLDRFKHPCNFIVIIDNFLFFKNKKIVEKNLKVLLETIMPTRINKEFNIKIFTKNVTIENKEKNEWKDNTKYYFEIFVGDIVKNIRKDIRIKVEVFFQNNKDHDRNLITNYFWFSCGYGFVLDDNERSKGTDVHIHCIVSPNVKTRMNELIKR